MSGSNSYPVKVYLYDISKGMARALSRSLLGKQIDGIWHTGVVVYGKEYYFGGVTGIESCNVGGTVLGEPDTILDMGTTEIPSEVFMDFLADQSINDYRSDKYNLLEHNCNNFSADIVQFLTGKTIPSYITDLPQEFLTTPLGMMIKPLIDQLSVQPHGGQVLFPTTSGQSSTQNKNSNCLSDPAPQNVSSPIDLGHANINHSNCQANVSSDSLKINSSVGIEPAIFRPDGDCVEKCLINKTKETTEHMSPTGDVQLWQEIQEYLSVEECSFSLGRIHLQIIGKAINDPEVSIDEKLCTCHLLQLLVLRDDFLQLLLHDTSHMISSLLTHFMEQKLAVKTDLVKIFANVYSSDSSRTVISKLKDSDGLTVESRISQICTSCLLDETVPDLTEAAAGLAVNISLGKIDYDTVLELGSALLHCLHQRLPTEKTTLYCLSGVLQFIKCNEEVRALAGVLGIDWSVHSVSSETKQISDKIPSQLSQ